MKGSICLLLFGLVGLANCYYSPFFSTESADIDSSEHGGPKGRKDTSCKCGWANKKGLRVVGGRLAKKIEFPFIVYIIDGRSPFCGGSILTEKHVLTAAHCTNSYVTPGTVDYGSVLTVGAGNHDLTVGTDYMQTVKVSKIMQHEGYDGVSVINDISVLLLRNPLIFSQAIGPVCMLKQQINLEKQYVKVTGWGRTSHGGQGSPILKTVDLRIVPFEKCKARYFNIKSEPRTQVCTHSNNQGSCMGDSGGPLTWVDPETNRYTLVGVVSFGRLCASTDPSVYTDPAYYIDWIQKQIQATSPAQMCYKV